MEGTATLAAALADLPSELLNRATITLLQRP